MKKFLYSLAAVALLGSSTAMAQSTTAVGDTCSNTIPRIKSTTSFTGTAADTIGGSVWSKPAELESQSGTAFPTIEYLVLKKVSGVTSANEYPILGATVDGVFHPAALSTSISIDAGDELLLVALGYNLPQIKSLVDVLLTGSNASTGAPCCAIVNLASEGFCDVVRNDMNINEGSDVRDLAQVLRIFELFNDPGELLTISSLTSAMGTVNSVGGLLGTCGGQFMPLCYGADYGNTYKYTISADGIAVNQISNVANFVIFPNPAANGVVNVTLETSKATELQVNLYNALGQRMHTENLGLVEGQRNVTVSTANLAAGIYAIELTDGTNKSTQTLIVK